MISSMLEAYRRLTFMQKLLLVLLVAAMLRFLFVAPLYLLNDEAYYWVWSQTLALSYFDHPPMVAWLIYISTAVFGDHPAAIRLPAAISVLVMSIVGLLLTQKIFKDNSTSFHYVLISLGSVLFIGTASGMTPDAPMAMFTALTLWYFYKAVIENSRPAWYGVGLFFGLALLSKYIAIVWGLTLLVFLLVIPEARKHLKRPGPWLAVIISIAVFSPVLIWNYQHDWASFAFQLNHGLPGNKESAVLNYFGGQAGLITPAIFIILLSIWIKHGKQWSDLELPVKYLVATSLIPFSFFIYAATKAPVSANWPAFAYFTGFILVAHWFSLVRKKWQTNVVYFSYGYLFLFAILIIAHTHFNILNLGRADRTKSYYGWPEIIQQAKLAAAAYPDAILVGNNYQFHSQLVYGLGIYTVPALNIGGRANHYTLLDNRGLIGRDLIIIDKAYDLNKFKPYFDSVEYIATLTGKRNGKVVKTYRAVLAKNYQPGDSQ